jgi:hypothetical protein
MNKAYSKIHESCKGISRSKKASGKKTVEESKKDIVIKCKDELVYNKSCHSVMGES